TPPKAEWDTPTPMKASSLRRTKKDTREHRRPTSSAASRAFCIKANGNISSSMDGFFLSGGCGRAGRLDRARLRWDFILRDEPWTADGCESADGLIQPVEAATIGGLQKRAGQHFPRGAVDVHGAIDADQFVRVLGYHR